MNNAIHKIILVLTMFLAICLPDEAAAQQEPVRDTLPPALKTGIRRMDLGIGEVLTGVEGMRAVVSPLGEGDVIRWAQNLPGVATGADGGSAIYVRGGNLGSNLITLDGVPVYGWSHLLGLTNVIASEAIGEVSLAKGGFGGAHGNFTSSHLKIKTLNPVTDKVQTGLSVNNFLASAGVTAPLGRSMTLMAAGRVSPLALEYRAVKGLLGGGLGGLEDFGAGVFDLYAKLHGELGEGDWWSVSGLGTMDRYSWMTSDDSREKIGWHNAIGLFRYHDELRRGSLDLKASYNMYSSIQEQMKIFRGNENLFSLKSVVRELTASLEYGADIGDHGAVSTGLSLRGADFRPGTMEGVDNKSLSLLPSAFAELSYNSREVEMKGSARLNVFTVDTVLVHPDFSLSLKWKPFVFMAVEATFDMMHQFYHTLEGLPVGWSMDMLVPSSSVLPAESVIQGFAGLVFNFGNHIISAGAYKKGMDGLIYFRDPRNLFNGSLSAWEDQVDTGRGDSKGVELLYEYQGRDVYVKASGTLSRSTRWDFFEVNQGKPFHAPFDRRIVANVTAEWKGISAAFIYQDGNWVNGRGERYGVLLPGNEETVLEYFATINNHQMPALIRLDLGYRHTWVGKKVSHTLNAGICNVLNRFNPFTVYFDTEDEVWKEMALLPILPNFSYRIEF